MYKFRYFSATSAYYANLSFAGIPYDDIIMKFDTGAAKTLLSLSKFGKRYCTDGYVKNIRKYIDNRAGVCFRSASGHEMVAYPCMLRNVRISDVHLDSFVFYLSLAIESNVALIGDDFISCCSFVHSIGSDIIINKFSKEMYESKINAVMHIDLLKVFEDSGTKTMNLF